MDVVFSVVKCVCIHIPSYLPVVHGHLNESPVNVLRDTGCSGGVVRRDLIRPDQFTGKKTILFMINCSAISVPVAQCSIESPECSGATDVLCM